MAIRLSDKEFFLEHLDLQINELAPLKELAEKEDFRNVAGYLLYMYVLN